MSKWVWFASPFVFALLFMGACVSVRYIPLSQEPSCGDTVELGIRG